MPTRQGRPLRSAKKRESIEVSLFLIIILAACCNLSLMAKAASIPVCSGAISNAPSPQGGQQIPFCSLPFIPGDSSAGSLAAFIGFTQPSQIKSRTTLDLTQGYLRFAASSPGVAQLGGLGWEPVQTQTQLSIAHPHCRHTFRGERTHIGYLQPTETETETCAGEMQ